LTENQSLAKGFSARWLQRFWKRGKPALFDQQPVEAHAMICACLEAYEATGDRFWLAQVRAFSGSTAEMTWDSLFMTRNQAAAGTACISTG
jgi:hypothetical protein